MKIKFSHEFTDHNGRPIKMSQESEKAASMKEISIDCLMYPTPKEANELNGTEKCKRHDLAVKILNFGDEAIVTNEDCVMLKKLIGDRYIPTIVAQAYALLEQKELPVYNK